MLTICPASPVRDMYAEPIATHAPWLLGQFAYDGPKHDEHRNHAGRQQRSFSFRSASIGPRTVFTFGGQGSQYFRMGWPLYQQFPSFRSRMVEMDAIVQELCGYSIIEVLYERGHTNAETFDRSLVSHPALFMVQFATAGILLDEGIRPDFVLGTSIGTFVGAAVTGCISMQDALVAVIRQASIVEACCQRGGMLAVLHDCSLFDDSDLWSGSELAVVNLPSHFVVAAPSADIQRIAQSLRKRGITCDLLPVPYAFHSSWIDAGRSPFQRFMRSIKTRPAAIPIVCTLRSELLTLPPEDYFWRAIREPIQLSRTIAHLESLGNHRYIDLGPTATLANLIRHALAPQSLSATIPTLTAFGHDMQNIELLLADEHPP